MLAITSILSHDIKYVKLQSSDKRKAGEVLFPPPPIGSHNHAKNTPHDPLLYHSHAVIMDNHLV